MLQVSYSFIGRGGDVKFDKYNLTSENFSELLASPNFKRDYKEVTNLSIIIPASDVTLNGDKPAESFVAQVEAQLRGFEDVLNTATDQSIEFKGGVSHNVVSSDTNGAPTKFAFRLNRSVRADLNSLGSLLESLRAEFKVKA